jgi:toxin ParE1/3/4
MNYKISKEAKNDIEKIWLYTFENWSFEQAERYFDLIMDEVEYIAGNPNSGEDFSNIRKGYFRTQVKSHFIFYKVREKQNEVEIIRILH